MSYIHVIIIILHRIDNLIIPNTHIVQITNVVQFTDKIQKKASRKNCIDDLYIFFKNCIFLINKLEKLL